MGGKQGLKRGDQMNLDEFSKEIQRTLPELGSGFNDQLHMVLGIVTEAGELADQYKKNFAYGRRLDVVNIEEELGDIMWYIINLCTILGINMEGIMEQNVKKLRARFPEKFDKNLANERDLDQERKTLEGASQLHLLEPD